jgi:hypothetical protein
LKALFLAIEVFGITSDLWHVRGSICYWEILGQVACDLHNKCLLKRELEGEFGEALLGML